MFFMFFYPSGCLQKDFTFILDASSRKSPEQWRKVLSFVQGFVSEIPIGEYQNHVAFVSYASDSKVHFFLQDYLSQGSILDAIDRVFQMDQSQNPSGALYVTHSQVFSEARGSRPTADKVAILVTDGKADKDSHLVIPEADRAKFHGIEMFVVGVTGAVDVNEIVGMAGQPDVTHAYFALSFNFLEDIKNALLDVICGPKSTSKYNVMPFHNQIMTLEFKFD